ncbi:hypothetical protein QBC39DRAFT_343470 [Podospora conica]|nr:hypothetical protein QBC39DRAFT_343470 [Schizothecium conicum]
MTDAGMYCHACHHQWQRGQGGSDEAIECPACHSASTEIVTPDNHPRDFHTPQPRATMNAPDSTPTPAPLTEARPTPPESRDHEMSDAPPPPPSNEQATGTAHGSNNNSGNASRGPQPQVVFFFPPVTFFTTTIIAPNHGPAPSPTAQTPAAAPNSTPVYGPAPPPAATPAPAPADRPSTEPRSSSFNFFPFNLFMPQRAPPQESPSAPPPTGANSPPSGAETPVAPPLAAAPENTQPGNAQPHPSTNGAHPHAHLPPFANVGGFFSATPFAHITIQGIPQPDGQHPPMAFNPPALSLLRMIVNGIPAMGGDAFYTEQDFEQILGRLWEQSQPQGAPPASQTAIDALEIKEVDDKMLGAEGGTRCVVCVDDLTKGEKVTALPCGHFFHGECVVPWLKMHNTCPTCRGPVETSRAKPGKEAAFEAPQRAAGVDGQQQQEGTA